MAVFLFLYIKLGDGILAQKKREYSDFEALLIDKINREIDKRRSDKVTPYLDIQIAHLATALHMDVSTLRRHCKKHLQSSPKLFLDRYRINKAKKQLIKGDKPSEIFAALGFREHKTFSTLFKRHVGLSPTRFGSEG